MVGGGSGCLNLKETISSMASTYVDSIKPSLLFSNIVGSFYSE